MTKKKKRKEKEDLGLCFYFMNERVEFHNYNG